MKKVLALLVIVSIFVVGCGIGPNLEVKVKDFCYDKNVAAVYECGSHIRVVSSLTGAGSTIYTRDGKELNCPVVAPKAMSPECRELVFAPRCTEKRIC